MLSILIPIYNYDVRKLVATLALQCQKVGIHYQILCFDDGSKDKWKLINRQIETVYGVSYIEFAENMGRSRIRNKLGFNAMYDHLLFLDCDSEVKTKRYIKNYINVIRDHDVVYGGTVYSHRKPKSPKKMLHWKFGHFRERLPVEKRLKQPWSSFRSNNFLITRDLFLAHPFDETLTTYGHEDTLFARQLHTSKTRIHHIHNPVKHGGLEKVDVFLKKTQESIGNLVKIKNEGHDLDTNLTIWYERLRRWEMTPLLGFICRRFGSLIQERLLNGSTSLRLLDLYKLCYYHRLQQGEVKNE